MAGKTVGRKALTFLGERDVVQHYKDEYKARYVDIEPSFDCWTSKVLASYVTESGRVELVAELEGHAVNIFIDDDTQSAYARTSYAYVGIWQFGVVEHFVERDGATYYERDLYGDYADALAVFQSGLSVCPINTDEDDYVI